jgi:hypothetical protein
MRNTNVKSKFEGNDKEYCGWGCRKLHRFLLSTGLNVSKIINLTPAISSMFSVPNSHSGNAFKVLISHMLDHILNI